MNRPLCVLLVEDNPSDAELIVHELRREGFELEWERVDTEAEYLARLSPKLDIILSDDHMPRFSGMRALALLRERGLDAPFILVSGTMKEEAAVEMIRQGAADYLMKDRLARLGVAVSRAMRQKRADEAARIAKAETERNLSLLETSLDTLAEGVVISDMDELVFFWNRSALAMHDYATQDECRRRLPEFQDTFEFIGADGQLLSFDQWPLRRILRGETVSAWESVLRKKGPDGWRKWFSFSGALAFDQNGRPSLAVLSIEEITKRKRTEQAVQRSQAMLQLVLNNIPQGVFWKDRESRYLGCNTVVARTFGLEDSAAIVGKADRDFACLAPEQIEFFVRKDREVMASSHPQLGIVEQATFVGKSTRWLETNKTPLHDAAGKVIGVLGTWQDITERKEAEEALEMMRFCVDRAGDSIFWINREGRILYANDAACAGRGYSREELLAMSIFDLDPDYQAGVWEPHFEDLKRRGAITLESRHLTKDGRIMPVEVHANHVHLSGHEFNFCFIRDITARKRNEEEIRRLAVFPQVNPNPVLELTAEGAIQYHNAAAAALARDLGFASAGEMLPPGAGEIVRECLARGESRLRLETPFGQRTVSWSFYPIPDHGIVHCYAGEITAQRQIAEQLRQVQKLESVGQLAAGIAHDFNNLLTVIQGYSDLLRMQIADPQRAVECVEEIAVATERAANLTRQLLLFSRKQAALRTHFDLNKLTQNLTTMLGRILGEDIELRLKYWPALPLVFADPGMIEQVITNLSVNARDAMPEGGRLEITTSVQELDATRVLGNPEAQPGRFVCLSVTDTGSGIPPESLPRIFEPFFTTKEVGKGTGLGLATVYGIVMQHKGVVEVNSQPNAGTRFRVFLPAVSSDLTSTAEAQSRPPTPGGSETILLVEDEPALRSLLEMLLKQAGYTVLTAASGAAALKMWPEHRESIKLMLTDMVMPEGLSGKQLADKLKAEKPSLRVVFMSGYNTEIRGGVSGVEEGFNFLQKPFAHPALLQTIRRKLDRRR